MITNIKIVRIQTGLTLRAFAAAHGLSESMLCRIERGTQYVPPGWRARLAEALGLSTDEVCDANGWPRILESNNKGTRKNRLQRP
jgi:transcriptional regulator with XRE-family HTH domain